MFSSSSVEPSVTNYASPEGTLHPGTQFPRTQEIWIGFAVQLSVNMDMQSYIQINSVHFGQMEPFIQLEKPENGCECRALGHIHWFVSLLQCSGSAKRKSPNVSRQEISLVDWKVLNGLGANIVTSFTAHFNSVLKKSEGRESANWIPPLMNYLQPQHSARDKLGSESESYNQLSESLCCASLSWPGKRIRSINFSGTLGKFCIIPGILVALHFFICYLL